LGDLKCHSKRQGQHLAGFWGNSDFEFLQKIKTQNGSCHCRLQKTRSEQLSLELNGFYDEASREIG
jgi:NAD(P)H-nitrite reductase large subunit